MHPYKNKHTFIRLYIFLTHCWLSDEMHDKIENYSNIQRTRVLWPVFPAVYNTALAGFCELTDFRAKLGPLLRANLWKSET